MTVYDGRYSAECEQDCAIGTCGMPLAPGLACGGCCRCLGGCEYGYEEQCAEEAAAVPERDR